MMIKYSPLNMEMRKNGLEGILTAPFTVALSDGRKWRIPKGFVTDFASVPRIFWGIVPPWGRYFPAALVHDYLYENRTGTRAEADRILLDIMAELRIARWRRWLMYLAVRVGGHKAWRT